jgi:hypothetical protein
MNVIKFSPVDNGVITFDWSEILPAGITLVSVLHTPDAPLVKGAESTAAPLSTVAVTGAAHGGLYNVEGKATLSNGEVIAQKFRVLGWNN